MIVKRCGVRALSAGRSIATRIDAAAVPAPGPPAGAALGVAPTGTLGAVESAALIVWPKAPSLGSGGPLVCASAAPGTSQSNTAISSDRARAVDVIALVLLVWPGAQSRGSDHSGVSRTRCIVTPIMAVVAPVRPNGSSRVVPPAPAAGLRPPRLARGPLDALARSHAGAQPTCRRNR